MATDHSAGPLKKSDLQFNYPPSVVLGDDPTKRNLPDSALLNRHEWYEVLYFVNKFANKNGEGRAAVAKKAEHLIHKNLPSNLRSHAHVEELLVKNWNNYN